MYLSTFTSIPPSPGDGCKGRFVLKADCFCCVHHVLPMIALLLKLFAARNQQNINFEWLHPFLLVNYCPGEVYLPKFNGLAGTNNMS